MHALRNTISRILPASRLLLFNCNDPDNYSSSREDGNNGNEQTVKRTVWLFYFQLLTLNFKRYLISKPYYLRLPPPIDLPPPILRCVL